jgi:uncharacterized protein YbjT (DUF2867 family)
MIPTPARRVIVTGATGLIGRALCATLQRRGYSSSFLAILTLPG